MGLIILVFFQRGRGKEKGLLCPDLANLESGSFLGVSGSHFGQVSLLFCPPVCFFLAPTPSVQAGFQARPSTRLLLGRLLTQTPSCCGPPASCLGLLVRESLRGHLLKCHLGFQHENARDYGDWQQEEPPRLPRWAGVGFILPAGKGETAGKQTDLRRSG